MNDNPMRDVIEQMKDAAQREGKQQTSPVAKAAMERRRLIECLTTARIETERAHKNLLSARVWIEDRAQADKCNLLYNAAKSLQEQIAALLQEVQGE